MKHRTTVRTIGVTVITAATATFGFSGIAAAEPADDVPILVENLPAAAEALANGLQDAAATAQESQSATETSAAVGDTAVASGTALVAGTEQFGGLALGLALGNAAVQGAAAPVLGAIDDPESAPDLLDPEDLTTIGENAAPAGELFTSNVADAVAEGLRGNLGEPGLADPISGTPSVIGSTFASLGAAPALTEGTTFAATGQGIAVLGLVGASAAGAAVGDYVLQAEEGAAPAFEAAEPATEQIIGLLQGLS